MSTNLHVTGFRTVIVEKTGKKDIQTTSFDLYQTSSNVTREILNSDNPAQGYRDWVIADRYEEEELVYAEDDIWGEGEPIGVKTVCYQDEHLKEFDEFIKDSEENGYELTFYGL